MAAFCDAVMSRTAAASSSAGSAEPSEIALLDQVDVGVEGRLQPPPAVDARPLANEQQHHRALGRVLPRAVHGDELIHIERISGGNRVVRKLDERRDDARDDEERADARRRPTATRAGVLVARVSTAAAGHRLPRRHQQLRDPARCRPGPGFRLGSRDRALSVDRPAGSGVTRSVQIATPQTHPGFGPRRVRRA